MAVAACLVLLARADAGLRSCGGCSFFPKNVVQSAPLFGSPAAEGGLCSLPCFASPR